MKRLFTLLLLTSVFNISLYANERIALIIGNADYTHVDKLKNPINDAKLMKSTLLNKGFTVLYKENANLEEMKKIIAKFSKASKSYKTSLFYYAGHGVEVNGKNYLIAVDSQLRSESEVKYKAIALNKIVSDMKKASNNTNIIILDACRSNPYNKSKGGLAPFSNPDGMFIAYAAQAGQVSYDGEGKNGVFTDKLVKNINQASLNIEEVFKRTRENVYKATDAQQRPSTHSELIGDFYFNASARPSVKKRALKRSSSNILEIKKHKRFIEPPMALIKSAHFLMGDNDDIEASPQHEVSIKDDFYMAIYELTFEEYDLFCKDTGYQSPDDKGYGRGKQAVVNVSYDDALQYTNWLSKKSGKNYTLPSEAQWEYAARSKSDGHYSFGSENRLDYYAWYVDNSKNHPYEVGLKKANRWGLHDMYGNVKEWCLDSYTKYRNILQQAPSLEGKAYVDDSDEKVIRGGAYNSEYDEVTSSIRESEAQTYKSKDLGFRIILKPSKER